MTDSSVPLLRVGDVPPDSVLPNGLPLLALRGQPAILAFAPDEWNPAHAYESDVLTRLSATFGNGVAFVDAAGGPWHSVDSADDLATRFGLAGRRALVLLDEQGVVRWKVEVEPGRAVRPGEVLSALEALRGDHDTEGKSAEVGVKSGALSRRGFLTAILAAAALLTLPDAGAEVPPATGPAPDGPGDGVDPSGTVPVTLNVNGQAHRLQLEPRVALLDALRESLHLTGTKKGCDHGQCGACTVHVDGESALSCLTLAVMNQGKAITTIEGLATGGTLHPLQAAFIQHDAFQCGYCTPGQLMTAAALMKDGRQRSDAEIREAMSGNICRCAAYPNIIAAIKDVQTA